MIDWKHKFYSTGFSALHATRATRWLSRWAQGPGVILTFHRVRPVCARKFAPNRFLEITPEFLDVVLVRLEEQGFDLVSLDDVPARLESGRHHRPFAALTFDDGYRDNLDHARPILRRHGAPWTLYIVTDFVERRGRLWWLELEEAIARLDIVEIDVEGREIALRTGTTDEKYEAYNFLCRSLAAAPADERHRVTGELARRAGFDAGCSAEAHCASWDEIAALARDPDVAIGSHTRSHPILRRHEAPFVAEEFTQSKAKIESKLGRPIRHLAYPHGDRASVGPREFALAREAGYITAVTTRPGHVWPQHLQRLTALPRVSINGSYQSDAAIQSLLSGVPFAGWSAFLQ